MKMSHRSILVAAVLATIALPSFAGGNNNQNNNQNNSDTINNYGDVNNYTNPTAVGVGLGIGVGGNANASVGAVTANGGTGIAQANGGAGGNGFGGQGGTGVGGSVNSDIRNTTANTNLNNVNTDVRNTNTVNTDVRNSSTNLNTNTSVNSNVNGQQQGQVQGQQQSIDNSGNNTGVSSADVSINVAAPKTYRPPVNSAIAPTIFPTAPCMGSTSAAATGTLISLSGGTTWTSDECMILETARSFDQAGYAEDGQAVRCTGKWAKAAPSCQAIEQRKAMVDAKVKELKAQTAQVKAERQAVVVAKKDVAVKVATPAPAVSDNGYYSVVTNPLAQ